MKKRRFKQRRAQQRVQTPPSPSPPPPREHRRWWSLLLRPKLLLIEIPSAIATFVGFVVWWNQAVPTIVSPAASPDAPPLAAPFTIENQSYLWTFNEVTTTCTFDNLVWANKESGGTELSQVAMSHPQPHGKISPGRSVAAECLIISAMHDWTKLHLTGDLVSARATIVVNYHVLGIPRTFTSQHFCWTPTPPSGHQWELCDQLSLSPL